MKVYPPRTRTALLVLTVIAVLLGIGQLSQLNAHAQETPPPGDDGRVLTRTMAALLADQEAVLPLAPQAATPCVGGFAGSYPCENVDLLAFLPLASIGGGNGNDVWGWTDPLDGAEYALMGRSTGTAFVDISDPENPVYLGNLPTHTQSSSWRDIKVYADYAFIVSEAPGHGLQVFDLTELRNVPSPPVTFAETAYYNGFGSAHNIVINESSGYAYAVGSNTCSGGLHMVNIQNPLLPVFAGCFSSDGYTHDAQCVNYIGPDPDYAGAEVCFNSNEDTLTIVDVTNKSTPVLISNPGYPGSGYTHQGWVTPDHVYFLLDDELDEFYFGHNTRTRVWDISDLDAPVLIGYHDGSTPAIDHNQYVHQGYSYQANYRSGLRILDIAGVATASLSEAGFFDIYPANDSPNFNGAWSVYPYFDSGVVVVSGIEQGLFVLQPTIGPTPEVSLSPPSQMHVGSPGEVVTHTFTLTNTGTLTDSYNLTYTGWNWATSGPTGTGVLLPGEGTSLQVTVNIPSAPAGPADVILASDTFTMTASSSADPGVTAQATGTTDASVSPGVSLSDPQGQTGSPGETLSYTFTLTNTGDYTDTFSLSAMGNWTHTLSITETSTLSAGSVVTFTLEVTLPTDLEAPNLATTEITAVSGLDDSVFALAYATSEFVVRRTFLPILLR